MDKLAVPEPSAVVMLQTQRFLFNPAKDVPGFAEAMWVDTIPKLFQTRLIESFENYDISHAPLRSADLGQPDYQLLIDIRRFAVGWMHNQQPKSACPQESSTRMERPSPHA